jgi:signal peptidase I
MDKTSTKLFFRDLLIIFAVALVVFLPLQLFFLRVVVGSSMEPNLYSNEKIVVNPVAYTWSEPQRGDVIIFKPPTGFEDELIKRIIGLPGETLEMKDGIVYIYQPDGNVFALDESAYIVKPSQSYYKSAVIPDGHYFVLGDNRTGSADSRTGFTVAREDIDGQALFIYWPPSQFGAVLNYDLP